MNRILFAAALAAALCNGARADEWNGPDKVLHLSAGAGISLVAGGLMGSMAVGAAAGCGAGVVKELIDSRTHQPSGKDVVVTCVGALAGATAGRLIVRRIPGGAEFLYRFSL